MAATRAEYEAPAACALTETDIVGMAHDAQELQTLLPGKWLVCSYPSLFGTDDEIGLEVTADGSWYKLYPDGQGGERRGTQPAQHGRTVEHDNGGYMQVDFEMGDGFTAITLPQFARVPLKMRVIETANVSAYLKNDAANRCATGPAPLPTGGPYTAPAACAEPSADPIYLGDTSAALSSLTGRWLACAGSLFGTKDDVGLDLTSDGHFYKLYAAADGALQRGQGFDREGTYELLDLGDYVQLNLTGAGGGTVSLSPAFGANLTSAVFNNMGVFGGNYVRVQP